MSKEELTNINMELIAFVGTAKSCFVESIDEALDGNIKEAKELLKEGKESFKEGHAIHLKLLQAMANGETMESDLLTIHAQCQLMSAEDFMIIAEKVIRKAEQLNTDK